MGLLPAILVEGKEKNAVRRKKTGITLAGAMVLALLGVVPSSAPVAAGGLSSCPQTKAEMRNSLDGGSKSNWYLVDRSFGFAISWRLSASHDVRVKWPDKGRIEWGGRADGTGTQYGWSTNRTHRESRLHALTYHCLGKRGADQGFPLSKFPRNEAMAARLLGGNSSNWDQMDRTGGVGWAAQANSSNPDGVIPFKRLPFGCLDYATNGQADHTCKGFTPPPRDGGTFWALLRRSDYN